MIFGILNSSQIVQKLDQQSGQNSDPFLENIVELSSFRETLMSSVGAHDFSLNESFQTALNAGSGFQFSHDEGSLADRFDMTGVLGHSHATSDATPNATETRPVDILLSNPNDENWGLKIESQLNVETLDKSKLENRVEKTDAPEKSKGRNSIKKVRGATSTPQISNIQKIAHGVLDTGNLLEGDGAITLSEILNDGGDGANEVIRNSTKKPAQSLLNTTSSQAHSNQVLVALQTLENGLRLYTRVQNMSSQDRAKLHESARTLLVENGFFGAEIVIDEFRYDVDQNKDGGRR